MPPRCPNLTSFCFAEGRYAEVIEPYGIVMEANDSLLRASLIRSSKEVELGEIQGLSVRAAYALAKLGKLEQAVAALEGGRARLLAEALEGNRRDLEQLTGVGPRRSAGPLPRRGRTDRGLAGAGNPNQRTGK